MFKIIMAASFCVPALFAQATQRPESPLKFDIGAMDKSANPCTDFYQYACGTWMKNNPIPPDQSRWGRFSELEEHNRAVLHSILEEAATPDPKRDAITRQIGDFYAACMDEKGINAHGLAPVEPELKRIREMKDKTELAAELARLHRAGVGSVFEFSSGQDFKDSTSVIAQLDQGGLGLPDRDYYLKDDAKSVDIRKKYVAHVQRMLELAGQKPEQATAAAGSILRLETELAKGSLDRVSRRDPEKIYHKMTKKELEALGSQFRVESIFHAMPERRSSRTSTCPGPTSSRPWTLKFKRPAWTTGRTTSPGTSCTPKRACCRPPSSRRASIFTGRRSPVPPRCGRAGSAASISPTSSWARRSARSS